MERQQINCRDYSNLYNYRSVHSPLFGKGIRAPYFSAYPMRSDFVPGEYLEKAVITFRDECCDVYNGLSSNGYINNKMLRQKK